MPGSRHKVQESDVSQIACTCREPFFLEYSLRLLVNNIVHEKIM